MNKELVIKNAKYKFEGELLNIVLKQISDYYELKDSTYKVNTNYKVGDKVILNQGHLLHGIGTHTDVIDFFSSNGVISLDYIDKENKHAFCYVSAFWNVKNEISLEEYIKNYSGIVAFINDKYIQVPYKELDNFVEIVKNINHWMWTAESSMEIRFMPSLAKNINQIGFIINTENKIATNLRGNSIFKESFNKEYAFNFINEKSKEKFIKEGFIADFFERADYIIFGFPPNTIEGIIVGREVEHNDISLNELKKLFPNSYICNLDGIIIRL